MRHRAANCCSPPARCSPGPICRSSRYAEGRDPRFLAIILRGALDGLATVAPVGDPDWVALRGDNALTLDGKVAGAQARRFLRAQSGDAQSASHVPGQRSDYRSCLRHALSRALAFRRPGFAGERPAKAGPSESGWLNRALAGLAPGGRVDPKGSSVFAVGPVTPLVVRGPAPVLSWSPQRIHAGERRHGGAACSIFIVIPMRSWRACSKTIPNCPPSSSRAIWMGKSLAGPARRKCAPISPRPPAMPRNFWRSRTGRASARWRSTAGTLMSTKASPPGGCRNCSARSMMRSAAVKTNMGPAWNDTVVALVHRVRPHRAYQRHRRHRPRHRDGCASGRRRAQRRPRHRRLAGIERAPISTRTATSSRQPICAPCSRAC